MISICMIITSLATAALAKGPTECHFLEPTKSQQCFAAAGQDLLFHLRSTRNTEMILTKDGAFRMFQISKNRIVKPHDAYANRSELFSNGTFKLVSVGKRDSGDYDLEEFDLSGSGMRKVHLRLDVQAPVSKPVVSQVCLSPRQMDVSCSSEGDAVEFGLYLDDHPLIRTGSSSRSPHTPGVSNVTVSLHGQATGKLRCLVRNNVTGDETLFHLKSCQDAFSFLVVVMVASASAAVTLLLLALCLGIKRLCKKLRPAAVDEDQREDVIIYSHVVTKNTNETGG